MTTATGDPTGDLGVRDLLLIHQLLGDYGHVVDDREWARFDELFTPDARLDYTRAGAAEVYHGLDAITAFFRDANHPSAHHVTNIVVTRHGDEVQVRSKFFAPYTRDTHTPKRWFGGTYDDVVVPTDRGWRFASRTCIGRWQFTADGEPIPPHRQTW